MNERNPVFILFVAALIFRVIHCVVFANEIIPGSDQMQEIALGQEFAAGNFYGVLDTYWAPLYPILIGIASRFIDSPVVPAMVVSVLAGSLIVPLTYIFVLQSYNRRKAFIAAAFAFFFPHLINSVVTLGSENVFIALVLTVLIVTWYAVLAGSTLLCFLAGFLLGLAYLCRPEAFGYLLYIALVVVAHSIWEKSPILSITMPQIAVILLGFFLIATPYLLYLRSETGRWTISGKTEINTIVGELDAETDSVGGRTGPPIKEVAKYFVYNLIEVQKALPVLLPLQLWLFVGLGLFGNAWGKVRFEREFFLILFVLVTIFGYAAAVVQLRYLYVLLPILFGWTAHGIVNFVNWLNDTVQNWSRRTALILGPRLVTAVLISAVFLYVLPLNFYMRSTDSRWEVRGYEERDAGLWLRQNSKVEPYVFSASRRPVFYAGARQLEPRMESVDEVLSDLKSRRVDYVITSERSLKRNQFLTGLDKLLLTDPDFELVYDKTPKPGYAISIFRRK